MRVTRFHFAAALVADKSLLVLGTWIARDPFVLVRAEFARQRIVAGLSRETVEAAGHRLEELLERDPANREARLALINYWREAGQIQKVQALLAELEQQNPDDPALRRE